MGDAQGIHKVMIARYGGSNGLRDAGALASALDRPRNGYYPDVIAEASALLESVAINHPFIDGNKRVAFALADCFLRLNGWCLTGEPEDLHRHWMALFTSGEVTFAHLEPWLRSIAVPLQGDGGQSD